MPIPQAFCAWKSFFLQWFESEASGTVKLPRVTIFPPIVNQDIQHIQCRGLLNFVWIFLLYMKFREFTDYLNIVRSWRTM